jgi:hypothetical protein
VSNIKNLSIMSGITAVFCVSLLVTLKFASDWRQVGGFFHLVAQISLVACANVRLISLIQCIFKFGEEV